MPFLPDEASVSSSHEGPNSDFNSSSIGTFTQSPYEQPQPQAPAPSHKTVGIVHPNGTMAWMPFNSQCSLETLKSNTAQALGLKDASFHIARATPLLSDTMIDLQCVNGEVLYLLPKVRSRHDEAPAPRNQPYQAPAPVINSPTSSVAASTTSWHQPAHQPPLTAAHLNNLSAGTNAVQGPWFQLPLDEKMVFASHNLMKLVNNSKQCTELQSNLEMANQMFIDCSTVYNKVEFHLRELIAHPAGNYLVSKCFDYRPSLIQLSANLICSDLKEYATHKHASYVIEAILTHQNTPQHTKTGLVEKIFSDPNRVPIAISDTGNFVVQKAIEACPDELLNQMVESVNMVALLSAHGAKMHKKVQSRMSRMTGGPHMHVQQQQPQQQQPQRFAPHQQQMTPEMLPHMLSNHPNQFAPNGMRSMQSDMD
eukprot:gene7510-11501_t